MNRDIDKNEKAVQTTRKEQHITKLNEILKDLYTLVKRLKVLRKKECLRY